MILRELDVVTARRAGNVMRYRLAHPAMGQACDLVRYRQSENLLENAGAPVMAEARRIPEHYLTVYRS